MPAGVHRPTNAEIRAKGEHHVLAELRRRGFRHTLTSDGRRNDISVGSGEHPITVQVRVTSRGQRRGWLVANDLEGSMSESLVYAFVDTQPMAPETLPHPSPRYQQGFTEIPCRMAGESRTAWPAAH